jgi:hypothetical protein
MKHIYTVQIEEDTDEGTFEFSLQGSGDTPYDPENLADLLVEVATTIVEEHQNYKMVTFH